MDRRIEQADGGHGSFVGTAIWSAQADGALYVEAGELVLPGQGRFRAERRNLWNIDLTVHFEDGRFFHQVPAQGGPVGHWCPPDQYDGHYDFSAWPRWQVTWQVRGPHKSYRSTTTYTREDGVSP